MKSRSASSSNDMARKSASRNVKSIGPSVRKHTSPGALLDPSNHKKQHHPGDFVTVPTGKRRRSNNTEGTDNIIEHKSKSPRTADNEDYKELQSSRELRKGSRRQRTQSRQETEQERSIKVLQSREEQLVRDTPQSLKVPQQNRPVSRKKANTQDSDAARIAESKTSRVLKGAKRRHTSDPGDDLHVPKRSRYESREAVESITVADKVKLVEDWVNQSCERRPLSDEKHIPEVLTNMSQVPRRALPSPKDSFDSNSVISKRSERSTASTHDTDYRQSMRHRNIYIERESAPLELMKRAHRIISRPRASPEMDDMAIQKLVEKSRRLQEDGEDELVQQLAPGIIPAMNTFPDSRLARNANQLWSDSVPVPLDASILTNPLPLPKPKPDLAFGYSQMAFTREQLGTIGLLVDDKFGRSYAIPDQKLHFPFLSIEFKSQAKNGTHYVATNQAAGAGAIAMNSKLDLAQRASRLESFDYNEPQFFSVTMDHELARLNVHWLQAPARGGQHSFHVEGLSKHLLDDPRGIRAVVRAIKNILDHGTDMPLKSLCDALEAYRAAVIKDRETATTQAQKAGTPQQEDVRDKRLQTSALPDVSVQSHFDTVAPRSDNLNPGRRHTKSQLPETSLMAPPKRTRLTQQVNDDTVAHLSTLTSISTANTGNYEQGQSRTTRSSTRPPPVEVVRTRAEQSNQLGWVFELHGKHIFVPEHRWQRTVRTGRAAVVSSKYNVWCYDD